METTKGTPQEMVTKYFRAEIKEIDEAKHRVLVTMSDQTIDSIKDIIDAAGWKKHLGTFNKRPVLLSSHNYRDLRNQIGKAEKTFVKDDALMSWLQYFVGEGNEEADWGWNLVLRGVAAYSVGFNAKAVRYWNEMTEEEQKEARKKYKIPKSVIPWRIFLEQELLENSQVVMPANPNAIPAKLNDNENCVVRKTAEDFLAIMKAEEETKDIENKLWEDEDDWKEIRYRVKNPDLFVRIRRKKMPGVTPPIFMLVGPLKSDKTGPTKVQSLRFPKPAWALAKAKAWVKKHPEISKEMEDLFSKEPDKFEDVEDKELEKLFPEEVTEKDEIQTVKDEVDEALQMFEDKTKEIKDEVAKNKKAFDDEIISLKQENILLCEKIVDMKTIISSAEGGPVVFPGEEPKDETKGEGLYANVLKVGKQIETKLKEKK